MSSKCPTRKDLNQCINVCVGAHDLICDCDEPTKHLLLHIFSHGEPYQVTKEQKDNIIKCLITTEEEDTKDVGDGLGAGDLEKLFSEDTDVKEEDDTG